MKVKFYTYCGEAGDLQGMIVAEIRGGIKFRRLFTRTGWFALWSLRRAKKKLMNQIELTTGQMPVEVENF